MNVDVAAELGRDALIVVLMVSVPAMATGMVVGLVISLLQSITSIQEQTLSFVPKIVVTFAVTVLLMPWIMTHLVEYTIELYTTIPTRF